MNKIWKDIVGYEGIYEISNIGEIRTKEGKITFTERHGKRVWKQRMLKLKSDRGGYKRASLWKDGKHQDWLVHRLVAKTYIHNPNNYPIINHKDGIPNNNSVDNLEWCTSVMNNNHAFDNRLIKTGKPIIVCCDGNEMHFRSIAKAIEMIGISAYRINKLLLNKGYYKSKDGKIYMFSEKEKHLI